MFIPDSISALVYGLKHDTIWTLGVWASAILGMLTMIPHNDTYQSVAFIACACLAMVGIMPLVKGQHNTLHNIFGISACGLSQLWVGLVGNWEFLIVWWVLYAISLVITKPKWCFVAEVWCIISIIFALCN